MPLHRARYAAHSDYCNRHSQKMHQTPLERIDRLPARARTSRRPSRKAACLACAPCSRTWHVAFERRWRPTCRCAAQARKKPLLESDLKPDVVHRGHTGVAGGSEPAVITVGMGWAFPPWRCTKASGSPHAIIPPKERPLPAIFGGLFFRVTFLA